MSWLTDLLKDIPLSSVLRERVALAEQKFKVQDEEIKELKAEVAALTAENVSLKQRLTEAEAKLQREAEKPELLYGCYYFGGDQSKLYCVKCYETQGKKHPAVNNGVGWRCTVCRSLVTI